jgi:hypothetical protein
MAMAEFMTPATPENAALRERIVARMIDLFGVSRAEAVGRIDRHWSEPDALTGPYEWLVRHETAEFWAKTIYYGSDVFWWLGEEGLHPSPYP